MNKFAQLGVARLIFGLSAISSISTALGLWWANDRVRVQPYTVPYEFEQPNIGYARDLSVALAISLLVSVIAYYICGLIVARIRAERKTQRIQTRLEKLELGPAEKKVIDFMNR